MNEKLFYILNFVLVSLPNTLFFNEFKKMLLIFLSENDDEKKYLKSVISNVLYDFVFFFFLDEIKSTFYTEKKIE